MITIEFIVIILCLLAGTRFGGMGLGLISGIGLFVLCFVFGLQPGKPPVDVMLTILAVIGCAATLPDGRRPECDDAIRRAAVT